MVKNTMKTTQKWLNQIKSHKIKIRHGRIILAASGEHEGLYPTHTIIKGAPCKSEWVPGKFEGVPIRFLLMLPNDKV